VPSLDQPKEEAMPTSPLYDSTRATLATRLPAVRDSQLDTLALILVGITQSVSAQLGKIARAMPLDTTQYAKEQRLRRFLDNERIRRPIIISRWCGPRSKERLSSYMLVIPVILLLYL
jgi:hypothetical protein